MANYKFEIIISGTSVEIAIGNKGRQWPYLNKKEAIEFAESENASDEENSSN